MAAGVPRRATRSCAPPQGAYREPSCMAACWGISPLHDGRCRLGRARQPCSCALILPSEIRACMDDLAQRRAEAPGNADAGSTFQASRWRYFAGKLIQDAGGFRVGGAQVSEKAYGVRGERRWCDGSRCSGDLIAEVQRRVRWKACTCIPRWLGLRGRRMGPRSFLEDEA